MSVLEPEDNFDATFDEIVSGLALNTDTRDVVNYTEMSVTDLMSAYNELKGALQERQELIHPTTPEGRDLISQFSAVKVVLLARRDSENG